MPWLKTYEFYQVLFVNVVAFCWSTYLSWVEFGKPAAPSPIAAITPAASTQKH